LSLLPVQLLCTALAAGCLPCLLGDLQRATHALHHPGALVVDGDALVSELHPDHPGVQPIPQEPHERRGWVVRFVADIQKNQIRLPALNAPRSLLQVAFPAPDIQPGARSRRRSTPWASNGPLQRMERCFIARAKPPRCDWHSLWCEKAPGPVLGAGSTPGDAS
jgi:hypothetical protein